jgi:hypothetical protein
MSDIATAVGNFVNYLVSGQWLGGAIDWIKGGISYFFDSLTYWIGVIWKRVYNALVGFWNWLLGGLEFIYNVIRPHLVDLLTVWFTFFGIKRMIFSETMSLKNKIIGIVATPFLSWFGSMILSSFLPTTISLPRAQYLPEDIILDEVVKHQSLGEDYTSLYYKTVEDVYHNQVIDEYVDIHLKSINAYEDYVHSPQLAEESVSFSPMGVFVDETLIQSYQVVDEIVIIWTTVTFYEDMVHDQVIDELVNIYRE